SAFWFDQSQNARSYGLCLLLSSALLYTALALRQRLRERPHEVPWRALAALAGIGLAGSLAHSYGLLLFGMVLLQLLVASTPPRVRLAVVAIGLATLAVNVAYLRLLTANTQLDLHDLWFKNDLGYFVRHLRLALDQSLAKPALAAVLSLAVVAAW